MKRVALFAVAVAMLVAVLELVREARLELAKAQAQLEEMAAQLRRTEARLDRCEAELGRSDMLLRSDMWLAAKKRKAPPRKLGLTLRVHPQAGIAPLDVRAAILVLDPQRILQCPVYSILWTRAGEIEATGKSGFSGDVACGPNGPLIHAPRPRPLRLHRPGEWVIHASLADHGLTLHDRQTVTVIGRGEE